MLPDNFSNDHPEWRNLPGYLHYDTSYLLICDNLLDFSHLSYVHEKTLGGSTAHRAGAPDDRAGAARHPGDAARAATCRRRGYYQRMRRFDGNVDRWFIYDFVLPGTLLMHSGGRPVGDAPDDMSRAVRLHSCQTLTPETETTTHYFFQQSCLAAQGDGTIAQTIYDALLDRLQRRPRHDHRAGAQPRARARTRRCCRWRWTRR